MMFGWIKSLFEYEPEQRRPKYRIIHDPALGFCPSVCIPVHGWVAIDQYGEESQSMDLVASKLYRDHWVKTKEEAGDRVNLHATDRGRETVWEAG